MFANLLICIALLVSPKVGLASDAILDPFVADNIEVFVEAEALEEAKIQAANQAMDKGLRVVIKRLLPSSTAWKAEKIKVENITRYLKSSEILWQRMTSTSYMAKMRYSFDKKKIQSLLTANGITYASSYQQKVLIIELDQQDDIMAFNDDLRSSLGQFNAVVGLTPFTSIMGDMSDEDDMSAIYFNTATYDLFANMLNRYQVEKVALVKLLPLKDKTLLLVRLIDKKSNKIFYKVFDSQQRSYYAEYVQTIIDDSLKGFNNCSRLRKYASEINADAISLKILNAMNACVTTKTRGDITVVQFIDHPDVFAKILLALGIKISTNGKAAYIGDKVMG